MNQAVAGDLAPAEARRADGRVPVVNVVGYAVSALDVAGIVEAAWRVMRSGKSGSYIACANPHSLVIAANDPMFSNALTEADVLLADGTGVVLAGRILGTPFPERVTGSEFFRAFSERAEAEKGVRNFFLGSSEAVLAEIRRRLTADFPSITLAGTYSPPFKAEFDAEDDRAMVEAVNAARPDVLWVGMTAPKQEKWIHRNRHRLDVPLIVAIGAVFDFYAGTVKRSPAWACRMGLEWLPRLLREPRRLWRRTFVSAPRFLAMVMRQKLFGA